MMRKFCSTVLIAGLMLAALRAASAASSPFVGTWKIDFAKSKLTGDTFRYAPAPGGKLAFSYGTAMHYTLACDGTVYATGLADATGTCRKTGPNAYLFTSFFKGKLTDKDVVTISADGKTWSDAGTHERPDGTTRRDMAVYARVGSGSGLIGTWKTAKIASGAPYTISFAATRAGLQLSNPDYKWKAIMKTDGSNVAVVGPTVPTGIHLAVTSPSPSTLHFTVMNGTTTLSDNMMSVSSDGQRLSWMSHAPGNTATTAVYDKQ